VSAVLGGQRALSVRSLAVSVSARTMSLGGGVRGVGRDSLDSPTANHVIVPPRLSAIPKQVFQ
jgi:hypothetical protein